MDNWQKSAKATYDRMATVILTKHARKNTYTPYDKHEKYFVRVSKKREKTMKDYKVLTGRIKKFYEDDTYLVRFRLPDLQSFSEKRFRIEDISDFNGKRSVNNDGEKKKKIPNVFAHSKNESW